MGFSDDFEANQPGLNAAPLGWSVSDGTVDLIGNGFFDSLSAPEHGLYVDLDGSSYQAGTLVKLVKLEGNKAYLLSFALAGNHQGGDETVEVAFGDATMTYSDISSNQPFFTYFLPFTPPSSGDFPISFHNIGGDNVGALLDDVNVTQFVRALPPGLEQDVPAPLPVLGAAVAFGCSRRLRRRLRSPDA